MTSFLYTKGIEHVGKNDIDLEADTICVIGVHIGSGNYLPSETGDESLADIPLAGRVGAATPLSGKTFAGGIFDATDASIPNTSSQSVDALVLFKMDAASPTSEAACYLIAYIDQGASFPYSPNGAAIPVTWSDATNKIFKIDGSP